MTENENRKAVFLDMDGTLYSHAIGGIPESAQKALKLAKQNGVLIFGCTGRNVEELKQMGVDLSVCDGWITLNGAYCFNDQEEIFTDPVSYEDMKTIVEYVKQDPFPIMFSAKDSVYMNMYDPYVEEEMNAIHTPYPPILPLEHALETPVYQMCPYVKEEVWKALMKQLHVQATRWTELAWDVNSDTCSKGNGIRHVCAYYGLKKENTYGFGDALNDIPMMRETGTGICMGNGDEMVKAAADHVTGHIDEDGLYQAFEKYGLLGKDSE